MAALAIVVVSCGRTASKEGSEANEQTEGVAAQNAGEVTIIPTLLNVSEIPKEIHYKGKVKNAVKWSDALGVNIVIATETGVYPTPKYADSEDAYLGDADLLPTTSERQTAGFSRFGSFRTLSGSALHL